MKFCFYGSIAKGLEGSPIGGGEQQLALIAKYINLLGHEVIIVDLDTLSGKEIDGIKIISLKERISKNQLKYFAFYKALKEINADVYYARIRSSIHLIALFVAHKNKAQFVYHLASDLDALSFKERVKGFYSKISPFQKVIKHLIHAEILFPVILRKADKIICQNENQYQYLYSKVKKNKLEIINNLFEYNESDEVNISTDESHNYFVFIGSLDLRKGINELKSIINSNPNQLFYIIGKARDRHGHRFVREMQKKNNVEFYGQLSHDEVMKHLSKAKGLLNTSIYEGFSNAFIEAWSVGVPVFSLYSNPSNVLENFSLGKFYNGDLTKMANNLVADSDTYFNKKKMISYVKKAHNPFLISQQIIEKI